MDRPILFVVALVGGLFVLLKATLKASSPDLQAFAEAIAGAEGFGTPGAIPTTHHNPGDLTDSDGAIRQFDTDDDGWAALYAQLELIANGGSAYYNATMTIADFASVWTATEQAAWASNVASFLRQAGYTTTSVDSSVSQWL